MWMRERERGGKATRDMFECFCVDNKLKPVQRQFSGSKCLLSVESSGSCFPLPDFHPYTFWNCREGLSLSHSRSLTPSLTLSPFLTLSLTPSLSHCLLLPLHLSFLTSSPFLTHSLSICLPLVLHFSLFSTFSLSITLLLAPHTHGIYPLGQLSTLSLYCKSQPLPSSSSHFSSCHPSPSISPLLLPPLLSLIFPHSPLNALHPLS